MSDEQKKRKQAAALTYDREQDAAPRLSAKGEGLIAEKIIALAKEHGVPITSDPDLFTLLAKLDVGQFIHPSLYEVVAELLVFIYRLKEDYEEGKKRDTDQGSHKPLPQIDENHF